MHHITWRSLSNDPKVARLAEIIERLRQAAPFESGEAAFEALVAVLNAVEDRHINAAFDPTRWRIDGRMYAPQADVSHSVRGRPELTRHRTRRHNIWIAAGWRDPYRRGERTMSLGESGRGWPDDRTAPAPLTEFGTMIRDELPGVSMEIGAPDNPAGEHWLDISHGDFKTNVAWRPAHGFGVYTSETVFGEGPDEVYKRPEDAVRRVLQLESGWRRSGRIEKPKLRELRELCRVSQTSVADKLGVTQVAISRLEDRQDVKLSSLFAYVEALGGRLEIRAWFDGFDLAIGVLGREAEDKVEARHSTGDDAPEDKAERAVAFARDLRKRANPEKGLPADKAFFDDLSGEGEGSDRNRS